MVMIIVNIIKLKYDNGDDEDEEARCSWPVNYWHLPVSSCISFPPFTAYVRIIIIIIMPCLPHHFNTTTSPPHYNSTSFLAKLLALGESGLMKSLPRRREREVNHRTAMFAKRDA